MQYKHVLILGFGASSLNVKALLSSVPNPKVPFHYLDTMDPVAVSNILKNIDLESTAIYVISKSGNTQETNILLKYLATKKCGKIFILSSDVDSELRKIAKDIDHEWINYAPCDGGRFALLTEPFLEIAKMAGADVDALKTASKNIDLNGCNQTAESWLQHFDQGKTNWVIINYCRQLDGLLLWIRQIVAESLGKETFGILPIIAEGTMDQHSQLQLFLDGPDDKFYDIISCDFGDIENEQKPMAESQVAHSFKVEDMLLAKGRIVRHTHHKKLNESVIGKYISGYIEVVKIIAKKKGFDYLTQPAVENMKQKSYEN